MSSFVKSLVSQDLKRYKDEAYDLDLSYIIPNIIAMGFPASGVEGYFRNHIEDVARYLNEKHKNHYLVINLSERPYDYKIFDVKCNRVLESMGFPDHHSPPLFLLFGILLKVHEWLKADAENVVVIHCLAGRGRTGTVITSYLLFAGYCRTISDALSYYAHQRSATKQGVSQPSQRRSTFYLDRILRHGIVPKPLRLKLLKLKFGPSPKISSRGGWRPLINLYDYTNCKEDILFKSDPLKEKAIYVPESKYYCCDFSKSNLIMVGDIVLKISHIGGIIATKYEEIVRLIFHTGMEVVVQQLEDDMNEVEDKENGKTSVPLDERKIWEDLENENQKTGNGDNSSGILLGLEDSGVIEKKDSGSPLFSQKHPPGGPDLHISDQDSLSNISQLETQPTHPTQPSTQTTQTAPPQQQAGHPQTAQPDQIQPDQLVQSQNLVDPFELKNSTQGAIPVETDTKEHSKIDVIQSKQTDNDIKLKPEVPTGPKQPQFIKLVFHKRDLDNAYKMDDTKFPANFTISFECEILEDDYKVKPYWDEELYLSCLQTYEKNKADTVPLGVPQNVTPPSSPPQTPLPTPHHPTPYPTPHPTPYPTPSLTPHPTPNLSPGPTPTQTPTQTPKKILNYDLNWLF